MTTEAKTLAQHRDYFFEMVRLKLWFAFGWLRDHPAETFPFVFRNRIDIYRKTDLYAGGAVPPEAVRCADPRWLALENAVAAAYEKHRGDATAAEFEAAGFALLKPAVTAGAALDFVREQPGRFLADFQCGSLRYDPPTPDAPQTTQIHIGNAVRPQSIFDDPAYLPGCLEDLMNRSAIEFGATHLATSTWLNSFPRWLALFPAEWQAGLTPLEGNRDVRANYGYWGQFITARGTFNTRYGERLRATGALPYWPRASSCSFAALRAHLKAMR